MTMINPEILSNHNRKYGLEIYHFTLPRSTCHHKTAACDIYCYGKKIWHNVKDRYEKNLEDSMHIDFIESVVNQIKKKRIKWVRIHPVGDFYSQMYFMKWCDIAEACPETRFLAYTRNHELELGIRLHKYSKYKNTMPKNLVIYYSVDETTEIIPKWANLIALAFKPPAWREMYQHMERFDNFYVCSNRCASCRACWAGKINIAFPISNGNRSYKPPGEKYHNPWYLRRDGAYIPRGGLNRV